MGNACTACAYRSYAKINLYLDVLDRRPDGYHNIETIFHSVALSDELRAEAAESIELTCNVPGLSTGPDNLVRRAAALLHARTGCREGARMHIEKRIPVAAGLAGGSGNAAATLRALDELWNLGLDAATLRAFALDLGSDVPYCLTGGAVAAIGRGEQMTPLPPLPPLWAVLVHPRLKVSTASVYGHSRLAHGAEKPFQGRTHAFRTACERLAQGDVAGVVFNRMESAVFHEHPELTVIKQKLLSLGCLAAAMSGSGPTVFGICADESAARRAGEGMAPEAVSVAALSRTGVERTDGPEGSR